MSKRPRPYFQTCLTFCNIRRQLQYNPTVNMCADTGATVATLGTDVIVESCRTVTDVIFSTPHHKPCQHPQQNQPHNELNSNDSSRSIASAKYRKKG